MLRPVDPAVRLNLHLHHLRAPLHHARGVGVVVTLLQYTYRIRQADTASVVLLQAEPSAGKATNLLDISISTHGPADGNAGVYINTMEAVPDSPGPSVAPPSPDAVERSSRRGWRGVDLSSQDDSALSASFNWDEREWQFVTSNNRGFQRGFSRSGGQHQHQA